MQILFHPVELALPITHQCPEGAQRRPPRGQPRLEHEPLLAGGLGLGQLRGRGEQLFDQPRTFHFADLLEGPLAGVSKVIASQFGAVLIQRQPVENVAEALQAVRGQQAPHLVGYDGGEAQPASVDLRHIPL